MLSAQRLNDRIRESPLGEVALSEAPGSDDSRPSGDERRRDEKRADRRLKRLEPPEMHGSTSPLELWPAPSRTPFRTGRYSCQTAVERISTPRVEPVG
jgi:hypothetical protein